MTYIHITENERRRIERLKKSGKSIRAIARALSRSPGTISEEIKENSVNGIYNAKKAHHKAVQKRKKSKIQCLKVAMDVKLKEYVTKHITEHQSPQGISTRLKYHEPDLPYASTKAIYKFVTSVHGRRIEQYLYHNRVPRKSGPKRGTAVTKDGRKMIDERPQEADDRSVFGYFEGDFIESGKDGTGSLLVLVERKTRYPFLVYIEDRSTAHINALIAELLAGVPVKSVTLDNDLSFQKHEALSALIGADIFFCHPYTSQEKGTVENRNGAVREYLPKGCDLSLFSREEIQRVETRLRNRFMVCLDGRTPREAWDMEMSASRATLGERKKTAGGRIISSKSVRLQG